MAYAHVDLVATAGQQNFAFDIPYLAQANISVFQNGVLVPTTDWTFLMAQIVRLDVGAAEDDIIRIKRVTPIDEPIVDYANGSVLGENELDATALQSLFAAQEVADSLEGAITQNDFLQWDAQGLPIVNLGDARPGEEDDAMNQGDFDDVAVSVAADAAAALAARNAAQTAQTAAELAENHAETAETNAELAETNAELAETNAETAQAAAAASASAAATSATTATTQAGLAATAKTAAETAETNAELAETNAEAAAADAALSAAKLSGTSTTSRTIGTGSVGFTTQAGKFFDEGTWLLITSDANEANYMHGRAAAYAGTALTVLVTNIGVAGTLADWTIRVSGTQGAEGAAGAPGADGEISQAELDAAIATHAGLADPHTQYQEQDEKDVNGGYAGLTGGGKIQPNAVETNSIMGGAVTFAKMQDLSAVSSLAGSSDADPTIMTITLGTNLSMSGSTLNATGGSGGDSLIYEFW